MITSSMNPLEKKEHTNDGQLTPTPEANGNTYTEHASHIAPMRTFSSDLANAIREKGGSVVRIAIAEEEKHRRAFEESSIRSKKNQAFTALGIFLVTAAIGILVWSYIQKQKPDASIPVNSNPVQTSLITFDGTQLLDITDMQLPEIYSAIAGIVATPNLQPGQVKDIVLAETVGGMRTQLSAPRLLEVMKTHAPDILTSALAQDFMLGTYLYNTDSLFLIIHGTAHDFLQSGMLAWEPYLFEDLTPLFNINTSGFTKDQLQDMPFSDTVVQNRNARAVFGADKKPILYYSFIDQNTILVTTDTKTLAEVVRRF
jgi:hypothetical protein